jgi:hypothetical protein
MKSNYVIKISIEKYEHMYVYKIFTSFHSSFPAITVTYRLDGKKYGEDMTIDVTYGSGGIKEPEGLDGYAQLAKEMSQAWKTARKIIKHHIKNKDMFKAEK